jgi:signal transduction histidine kinase/CheY-like chemotaxis protein
MPDGPTDPSQRPESVGHARETQPHAMAAFGADLDSGLTNGTVDRLVDRLSTALRDQHDIVRELSDARADLVRRHEEADAARRRAERAMECLTSFLHALGHDLRAPFVGIDASLQLLDLESAGLRQDELRARVAETAAGVRRTCAFGLSMVADLFELMRTEAGTWRVQPRRIDLLDLVREVRALVLPQARAKGLDIALHLVRCDEPGISSFRTDPDRLRQALVNVLANAVKFSDAGTIDIEIARRASGECVVRVLDRGPGLAPDALERIFEPFHQSERTSAHAGEGLGLGLAIADRCARLLGGSWTAANREGGGAIFTLVLPEDAAGEADASTAPASGAPVHAAAPSRAAGRTLRILVVDDEAAAARLAAHHLRVLGHAITTAASLGEARGALALPTPFDLILADFELPDGDGSDMLALARGLGNIPVILSSARVCDEMLDHGAAAIVPKPLERAELAATLARVLAGMDRRGAEVPSEPR